MTSVTMGEELRWLGGEGRGDKRAQKFSFIKKNKINVVRIQ